MTTTAPFHVLIIGGGLGGLCLAQGLKKVGIQVDVYERDHSANSRLQGYRIHIDPDGSTALHECLPKELWELFDSTGSDFSGRFTFGFVQSAKSLTDGSAKVVNVSLCGPIVMVAPLIVL